MQLKLSFYDWCISILSSKKCQTSIILADLLGNESFLQRVQKVIVCDLWLVDFDPFCEFLCFKVRCLWSYCDQNPTLIFQIFFFFSSLDFRLPNNDEEKIQKSQINFWDRKGAIKCRASRAFFPTCLLPCTRSSHGGHSPRLACLLGLFTCLARIAYCTFASKQAVSITLFGPLPNNEEEEG